jgi:phosphoenolpyruvate carboxykinase (ATP)
MPTQDYIVASGASCNSRGSEIRGLQNIRTAYRNGGVAHPVEQPRRRGGSELAANGALAGRTVGRGPKAVPTPNDKHVEYVVRAFLTGPCVQWGSVNQSKSEARFNGLFSRAQSFWHAREVCVQDCFVGADAEFGIPNRAIGQSASTGGIAVAAAAPPV